jgi:uncharacterized membrane protein
VLVSLFAALIPYVSLFLFGYAFGSGWLMLAIFLGLLGALYLTDVTTARLKVKERSNESRV